MKFLDRLFNRYNITQDLKEQYNVCSLDELQDLGFDITELYPTAQGGGVRPIGRSKDLDDPYEEDFEPPCGWDKWCSWASKQGKIAQNLEMLSKNAMSFEWSDQDPEEEKFWADTARRLHLHMNMIIFFMHWEIYGRLFVQPVYTRPYGTRRKEILKLQRMDPTRMKVIWDDAKTVQEFNDWVSTTKWRRYKHPANRPTPGTNIIGYVQNWDDRFNENIETTFFAPDELIYIPRYPTHDAKDGMSLLRNNYKDIRNKIIIENSQAIMARRHVDPKMIFYVPEKWWAKRRKVINAIKTGLRRGMEIFAPQGFEIKPLELQHNGEAVAKAQKHIESQVTAGMGVADSFTLSESSNRSVGEIQLVMFERNLTPERKFFAEIFEDHFIIPYLREHGYKGTIRFKWDDLTPEDIIDKGRIMVPLVPFMTRSMVQRFFDKMGIPPGDDEMDELMERLEKFVPPRNDRDAPRDPSTGHPDIKKPVKRQRDEDGEEGED